MTEVFSLRTGRAGDPVLDVSVGVGVRLFTLTSLLPLLLIAAMLSVVICNAVVILAARDGDGDWDGEGEEAAACVTVVVEDDVEVVEEETSGLGVREFGEGMNSFRTPAGTDIMGAAAVSISFMVEGVGEG